MTKEEVIKDLIDMAKNGANNPLDAYCDSCSCLTCPFHSDENGECPDELVGELIGRLIKAEEKKETNFDHYYDSKLAFDKGVTDDIYTLCFKVGTDEAYKQSGIYDFKRWLLSPYEEPKQKYKLTQFEYDLLSVHAEEALPGCIHHYWELKGMCAKGYFKDISNDVPIKDIINNCEVVEE